MKFETKDSSWTKDFKIIEHTKPFRNPLKLFFSICMKLKHLITLYLVYRYYTGIDPWLFISFLWNSWPKKYFLLKSHFSNRKPFTFNGSAQSMEFVFFFFLVKEKQNELQKERKEMKTKKQTKMKIKTWRGKKNQKQIE